MEHFKDSQILSSPCLNSITHTHTLDFAPIPEKLSKYRDDQMKAAWMLIILCSLSIVISYADRSNISVTIIDISKEYGWDMKVSSLVLACFYAGYMVTQALGGLLADEHGGKNLLASALFCWSLFTVITPLLPHSSSFVFLLISRLLLGLAEGLAFPAIHSLIALLVPKKLESTAVSLVTGSSYIGIFIAFVVCPFIVEFLGWRAVFYVFGLIGFLWIPFWLFFDLKEGSFTPRNVLGSLGLWGRRGVRDEGFQWGRTLSASANDSEQSVGGRDTVLDSSLRHDAVSLINPAQPLEDDQPTARRHSHEVSSWLTRAVRGGATPPSPRRSFQKGYQELLSIDSPPHLLGGLQCAEPSLRYTEDHFRVSSSFEEEVEGGGPFQVYEPEGNQLASPIYYHTQTEPNKRLSALKGMLLIRRLLRKKCIWAIILCQYCQSWGMYGLISWLPTYLEKKYEVDLCSMALFASTPYFFQSVVALLSGILVDWLHNRGFSIVKIRCYIQIIALVTPAIFLMTLVLVDVTLIETSILLSIGTAASALSCAGVSANQLDLSEEHAGLIFGLGNTAGTLSALIAIIASATIYSNTSNWNLSFAFFVAHYLVGAIAWLFCMEAKRIEI